MPTTQEHIDDVEEYVKEADETFNRKPVFSGELIWGAVVQATQAAIPPTDANHHSHSKKGIINAIGRSGANRPTQRRLARIAQNTAKTLHGGFYQPRQVTPEEYRSAIADAKLLINHLTRHARRAAG